MDCKVFVKEYVEFYSADRCIACGAAINDNVSFFSEVYHEDLLKKSFIFCCNTCGLAYSYPFLSEEALEGLYEEDYFNLYLRKDNGAATRIGLIRDAVNNKVFGFMLRSKRVWTKKLLTSFIFQRLFQTYPIFTQLRDGERICVLDFGCGDGSFLTLAKNSGCEAFGVEGGNEELLKRLRDRGLSVTNNIDEYAENNIKFDIVRINHVLEHMIDPNVLLAKVSPLLKDGGELIIGAPNFNTPAKIFRQYFNMNLPHHRYYFAKKNITLLLKKHGFQTVYCKTKSAGILSGSLLRKFRCEGSCKSARLIDIFLSIFFDMLNIGDCMEIYCTKSSRH